MLGGPYGAMELTIVLVFLTVVAVGIFSLLRRKAEPTDCPVKQEDDPAAAALAGQGWLDAAMEGQSLLR